MKIVDELNRRGYKTKTNRPFRRNSLSSILENEKYIGTYVYNKTVQKINGKRNNRVKKPEDQIIRIKGGIPAIITKNVWIKAKERRELNKHSNHRKKNNYILRGLIYCGQCGSKLIGNTRIAGRNKNTYVTYECYNRRQTKHCNLKAVYKEYLENLVIIELEKFILDKNYLPILLTNFNSINNRECKKIRDENKALEHNLSRINYEIDNIINAVKKGSFSDLLDKELNKLENNKQNLIYQIKKNNDRINELKQIENKFDTDLPSDFEDNLNPKQIKIMRKPYKKEFTYKFFNELLPENQATLINEFINKILVSDEYYNIYFNHPQSLTEIIPLLPHWTLIENN